MTTETSATTADQLASQRALVNETAEAVRTTLAAYRNGGSTTELWEVHDRAQRRHEDATRELQRLEAIADSERTAADRAAKRAELDALLAADGDAPVRAEILQRAEAFAAALVALQREQVAAANAAVNRNLVARARIASLAADLGVALEAPTIRAGTVSYAFQAAVARAVTAAGLRREWSLADLAAPSYLASS